jgi:tetratricopeptide (TPR) repeat protein
MNVRALFPLRIDRCMAVIMLSMLCAGCSSPPAEPEHIDLVKKALENGKKSYAKAVAGGRIVSWTDLDEALKHFTQAISNNVRCAEAYYERGKVFYALGLYELACEDDTWAVQFKPNYPEAYFARAEAFSQLGNFCRAVDDAKMTIRLDPQKGSAYTVLGKAYFHSDPPDYLEAKNSLLVAQRLDKNFDAADLILEAEKKLHPPPVPVQPGPAAVVEPKRSETQDSMAAPAGRRVKNPLPGEAPH